MVYFSIYNTTRNNGFFGHFSLSEQSEPNLKFSPILSKRTPQIMSVWKMLKNDNN